MKLNLKAIFITLTLLSVVSFTNAQMQITLTSGGGSGATNCGTKTIETSVTGGSGNYMYIYSSNTASVVSGNTPNYTVNPQPSALTTYSVTVLDLTTMLFAKKDISISPSLIGDPNVWITNILTPNGDGINDEWVVADGGKNPYGEQYPINVYRVELSIIAANNRVVFKNYATAGQNGHAFGNTGFVSRSISWDGNDYDGGGYGNTIVAAAPTGTYRVNLKLFNCSNPNGKDYSLYITLIR
ncbi:hypothetical protein [Pedobacter gandavensis]|uniref:hypothetical protein n=1 Tax=Pedobacter gandavensis TaxID=2679963 RepID=UPI002931AE47|nr:hypothetical protein [Pedobacter gandavensis]